MEQMQENPLLEQENYFAPYNKSIEELKNKPEIIAFDKLCYEVFEASEMGRKFIEVVKDVFFIASFPGITRGSPTYQIDLLYVEGWRDGYRKIMQSVMSHKQRIQAEGK